MKRPGRPRLDPDDPSVHLTVRLPSKQFDASQKKAAEERLTMAEWIRQMLAHGISQHKTRQ